MLLDKLNLIGNEKLASDDKKQNDSGQDVRVGMVQSEVGGNFAGSTVHKDNQETGKYHGQRIKFGHPGYQYGCKALSACNRGGDGMVNTTNQ